MPPQAPPRWTQTPSDVASAVEQAISRSRSRLDAIASLSPADCSFSAVAESLAQDDAEMAEAEHLTFYQYVSPSQQLRDAAVEAEKKLNDWDVEAVSRLDVFRALQSCEKNVEKEGRTLEPEQKRLLEKLLLQRKRMGLGLDEQGRKEFSELKKEMSNLQTDFSKNFNEENGGVWFSKEDLVGVPEDVVSGFEEKDGSFRMTFKTPDYMPVMKYARSPTTRKRAFAGYESRLLVNGPILSRLFSLRRKAASVIGYPTWADYVLEPKMAKKRATVEDFLEDLREKLEPIGKRERAKLLELKREEIKQYQLKDANPDKFFVWDYRYYDNKYLEKTLDLKEEEVKAYFPCATVVDSIAEIYQSLLNVKFFRVPDEQTWHKEAAQFAVWDGEAVESGRAKAKQEGFLGYMHLDLYPRPGKYSHAAVWGLIPGHTKSDQSRAYPVAAMVANLAKATPSKPALMTHDSLVTYFHEMGHAFHQLCSVTQYARFHGTHVARDFVEAPSQMLENWCFQKPELERMSSHYERKGEKLPAELIAKIIKSRFVNSGLFNLRQLFFGKFDMMVHTSEGEVDHTKAWCDMRRQISLVDHDDESEVGGWTSFGHIAGGYDAGYYGYLYSLSMSTDMFASQFAADPMSAEKGAHYRAEILRPGGSRDEMDSLVAFLGREPSNEAFMKQILGEGA